MKRFCETTRFDDPFYSGLPVEMKIAREYITAKCDNAGVWFPNFTLADFQIGAKVDWQNFSTRLESAGELAVLPNGSWLIKWFIGAQYGELKDTVNAHRHVLGVLKKHGLSWGNHGIVIPSRWDKDTHKDQDPDKDRKEVPEETKSITPSLETVLAYAASPQGNVPADVAEIWWNEHEQRPRHASGGFLDKNETLVADWKAALRGYALKWRANDHKSTARSSRPAPPARKVDFTGGF